MPYDQVFHKCSVLVLEDMTKNLFKKRVAGYKNFCAITIDKGNTLDARTLSALV